MKYWLKFFVPQIIVILLLTNCSDTNSAISTLGQPTPTSSPLAAEINQLIPPDLESLIEIIKQGNVDEIISLIELNDSQCTNADGLGGPPKCNEGEPEGSMVRVLPIMGPEGHFIRESEIESWVEQLEVTELYAIYEVSVKAYSDENYPVGDIALVFIGEPNTVNITFQIKDGRIVRVDYGFGSPPHINENSVEKFLLSPPIEGER